MRSGACTVLERARQRSRFVATAVAVLVMLVSSTALAGSAWTFSFLHSARPYHRLDPGLDPDSPALRYAWVGRWRAMAGGSVLLFGARSDHLDMGISLDGFVELVNFTTTSPVPWESFRGYVGFDTHWESPWLNDRLLPAHGRLILRVGWHHESDHAVAVTSFIARFGDGTLDPYNFQNGDLSSWEHFKLRVMWVQELAGRLNLQITVGTRLFPKPIDPFALRELRAGILGEARLTVRIREPAYLFVGLYAEALDHRFDPAAARFRSNFDARPLRYLLIATGLELRAWERRAFVLQLVYSFSHGRGIDFAQDLGHEFGVAAEFWM